MPQSHRISHGTSSYPMTTGVLHRNVGYPMGFPRGREIFHGTSHGVSCGIVGHAMWVHGAVGSPVVYSIAHPMGFHLVVRYPLGQPIRHPEGFHGVGILYETSHGIAHEEEVTTLAYFIRMIFHIVSH